MLVLDLEGYLNLDRCSLPLPLLPRLVRLEDNLAAIERAAVAVQIVSLSLVDLLLLTQTNVC